MTEPISLLIPCYNAAAFLPRLMECVRAQREPFAAVIAYDDGSTDGTAAVARELGIDVIRGQQNRGAGFARNQLAIAATTPWIHFHDADDLLAPDFVAALSPWCDDRADVVSCDADWVDEQSRELVLAWRYDPDELARDPLTHLLRNSMSLNNTVIRRSAWERVGGCDETLTMWEDADVHVRLARSGARFHHVPAVKTTALRRTESFSHDYLKSWNCRTRALEGYAREPLPPAARVALGAEAERAAAALLELHATDSARRALSICYRVGHAPPTSRHPAIRFLKPFVPALTLLRWQQQWRKR